MTVYKTIADLPAATTVGQFDSLEISQGGISREVTVNDITALVSTGLGPPGFVLADGYGTTRNEVTFNAAAADAKARGLNVLVGPGTWTSTSGGVFINPGVEVVGAGPTLTRFVKVGAGSLFKASGTTPATTGPATLAANAAVGAKSITLTAGQAAAFAVDQKCILLSNDLLIAGVTGKRAEFVTVQSIAGDVVGVWGPLKFSYTTANAAKLVPVTLLEGVAYRNLSIQMDVTTTVNPSTSFQDLFAIDLRWCRQSVIANVYIHDIVGAAIFLAGCSGTKISQSRISNGGSTTSGGSDPVSTDGPPGFGYGVREDALNEELIVEGLTCERLRHGYTNSAGYASVWDYGAQYGTTISHSVHIDAKDSGWDCHLEAFNTKFIACGTIGGRTTGFQIRSRGALVDSCYALRTFGPGLWLRGGASGASGTYADECSVSDFYAADTNFGVDPITGLDWRENGALMDEGFDNRITGATAIRCGGPLLTIGRNGVAARGVYSALTARDVCQLATTNKYAVHIVNASPTANLEIDGLASHSTDGKVQHVVYRGTTGISLKLKGIGGAGHTGKVLNALTDDLGIVVMSDSDGPNYRAHRGPRQHDNFLGNALSTVWKATLVGSNPACIAPTIVTTNPYGGRVRLTAGSGNSGLMTTDGVSMVSALNWRAEAGGLTAEFSLSLSSVALEALYAGLTDDVTTLEMPFTLAASDVLTSTATNAVGFLYDTAASTVQWCLVGVAADVDATKQFTGIVPVSGTFQRLRIDVLPSGVATFFINGAIVGTAMTGAVTASAPLTPIVAILSRTTAVKTVDIDSIYVEQDRIP